MELQQTQITELMKAMRETKNRRLHELYQVVYLQLSGYKMTEIAQIVGHIRKIISCYVAAYRNGGIEAFTPHHSQRGPRRLSKKQATELKEIDPTTPPSNLAFDGHSNWMLVLPLWSFLWNKNVGLVIPSKACLSSWNGSD